MWTAIGLVVTAAWLFLGWFYVFQFIGFDNFMTYNPNEIGTFFFGFFSPLAFLWLLVVYFRQRGVLAQLSQAREVQAEEMGRAAQLLERQGEELGKVARLAERQTDAVAAGERMARREAFLRYAELTIHDLNTIVIEVVREAAPDETMARTLATFEAGYRDAFASLLVRSLAGQDLTKVGGFLERSADFPRNVRTFGAIFGRLLDEAAACDPDGHLRRHFEGSAMGRLNEVFRDVERHYLQPGDDTLSVAEGG